jgi:hypothetical protein
VMRFWNIDVIKEWDSVEHMIVAALEAATPHPNPPPQGGRGNTSPPPLGGRVRVGGQRSNSRTKRPSEEQNVQNAPLARASVGLEGGP